MILLYPSYSFETLASDRTAEEAAQLLAAWSAAFHPALIEHFAEIPRWESASIPPYDASGQPILIPPCCESFLGEEWFQQQETAGTPLVRGLTDRDEILARIVRLREIDAAEFDAEFVADFQALGTTYFLVDMLVRQLHYMSMMDDSQTSAKIFQAIKEYQNGNLDAARSELHRAFEAVCESKEYFYPLQTYFLDLTLITSGTVGSELCRLLEKRDRLDLFLPPELLETLPEKHPETFAALKAACEADKVRFVLGDTERRSLLLLPILDVADRILEAISLYRELLGVSPTIYGRLRAGLTPLLPQLLVLAGMKGALHFAPLDGWRLKEDAQSKMIWQGVDGTKLDALVRYPLDGDADLDFFELAERLGETINNDHAPTAVFARFPVEQTSEKSRWLDDLRRMGRYATELGSFVAIDRYFDDTPQSGGVKQFGFGKYPDRALVEAVEQGRDDPISAWNDIHVAAACRLARGVQETLLRLLGREPTDAPLAQQLARCVLGGKAAAAASTSTAQGRFVFNPWSFPRRAFLDVSDWNALPDETAPVVLARESAGRKELVVDIPPLGYAYVEPPHAAPATVPTPEQTPESSRKSFAGFFRRAPSARSVAKSDPPLIERVEDSIGKNVTRPVFLLRNEHFEAKIDVATGMLRSIFTDRSRFNRLSRQLALRLPKEKRALDTRTAADPNRGYAVMAADTISVEQRGPITGVLRMAGRLVCQDGTTAATFEETVTIRRRSRVLRFDLTLRPDIEPGELPWDSYYAIRYAWNDNTLDLRAGLGDGVHTVSADRIHAPRFVDLRGEEKQGLTFFSEGLPFHRRFGERQLDTLLIVRGEKARTFRSGIGVDLAYPVPAATEFLVRGDDMVVSTSARPKSDTAWLFRIEAKSVVALHWAPLIENDAPVGFQVFLLETEGRRANFALHSFREPCKAVATDLLGEERKELKLDADAVLIDMRGHELLPLQVRFVPDREPDTQRSGASG